MLREMFPRGRFAPPATDETITAAERSLGVPLPRPLRLLYEVCDGFREDRGNAKYLLSLFDEDSIGSLVKTTRFLWTEVDVPDLRHYVFFGCSSADEYWGIHARGVDRVIAYHHSMVDEYEIVGIDILDVYRTDYAAYPPHRA